MSRGLSRYWAAKLLEASVGRSALPAVPDPLYLALLKSPPRRDMTGATVDEGGYTGYARVAVPKTSWRAADEGLSEIRNGAVIALAPSTAGQIMVVGWALLDAAAAGNVLWLGESVPFLISPADPTPRIPIDAISLQFP